MKKPVALLQWLGLACLLSVSSIVCAETAPYITTVDKISAGDTAWMLTSTALVLLMTIPGLALFYSGMVRKKNVLATTLQSFVICAMVTVVWVVIGYSLAFTPSVSPYIGSLSRVFLDGMTFDKVQNLISVSHLAPTIPESVMVMFQLTFAIITPALITGAFAERMVHINAGAAGLVCAYMLGKRKGYGREPFFPNNLVYTMMGASLLWVGWFGFNAGSALAADGRAGMAMLVTQVAAATGVLGWLFVEWVLRGRVSLLGACSGAVAGLVAITPASGFVDVKSALIIGAVAGVSCYWGATGLKRILGADDSLDVFGIHGIGGIVGALLTGVFATKQLSGLDVSLTTQAIGAFSTLLYSLVMSWIILTLIDWTIGLRVEPDQEQLGLDLALHGEQVP